MDQPPSDELTFLRNFLAMLESGEMSLSRRGNDVTADEISVLKREIAFLEKVLARSKAPLRRPTDPNQLAKQIIDEATTENAAAVALGRLGGIKGGKARAEKLSSEKRAEIARKAAAARWKR